MNMPKDFAQYKRILVTGGAGFIGSNLIKKVLSETNSKVFNIDFLDYSSDVDFIIKSTSNDPRHVHLNVDLRNKEEINLALIKADPDLVIHLAAQSHVDRSIDQPKDFIESNILGTFNILEASRKHWANISIDRRNFFKFHHVSTDEVFGTLGDKGKFSETTPYSPRSPYSASKASSDHLVQAWYHTFNLPVVITNCSNNFGPNQFPEKLIPLTILKALNGEKIPIYGNGKNIRDWLFVEDHVNALLLVASKGVVGKSYCISGNNERENLEIVNDICLLLDKYRPKDRPYSNQINFVKDRPGHDKRYSLDASFIKKELGWEPVFSYKASLEKTVLWYLENQEWCKNIIKKSRFSMERLGL